MTDDDGAPRGPPSGETPERDETATGDVTGERHEPTGGGDRRRRRKYTPAALSDYVWYNRWKALRDGVAALVVVVVVAVAFAQTGLPAWTFYVFLLLALMLYTRLVEPWQWPDEGSES